VLIDLAREGVQLLIFPDALGDYIRGLRSPDPNDRLWQNETVVRLLAGGPIYGRHSLPWR